MTFNDYVKYLTIQVWTHYTNEEKTKKERHYTINNHWLGLFPFTLKLYATKNDK